MINTWFAYSQIWQGSIFTIIEIFAIPIHANTLT